MSITDQDKLVTDVVVATGSAVAELETIEDLLEITQDETGKVEGSSPDISDRLAMAVRLILDLGSRLVKVKNALLSRA